MQRKHVNWLNLILTTVFVVLFSNLLGIPLGGTYSVGGASSDFSSLNLALNTANSEGLGANTVFNLTAGLHVGPFVINIPNNTYSLTIQTQEGIVAQLVNPSATYTDNYILKVINSSNLNIKNLHFISSGTYSRGMELTGNSDNITISSNVFEGVQSTSTSGNEAIYFSADGVSDADNIQIRQNSFINGGYHVVASSSSSLTSYDNWTFYINGHTGGYGGIYVTKANGVSIYGEIMENVNTGIYLDGCSGNLLVHSNYIEAKQTGLGLYNSAPSVTAVPNVYNNVIRINGIYWYNPAYYADAFGLVISGSNNIYAAYNSIRNSSQTTGSCTVSVSGSNNKVKKNIMVADGSGYGIYVDNLAFHTIEYNNIYAVFSHFAKLGNNWCDTLADFNALAGTDNISFYPFFTDGYLRTLAPHLDNYGPALGITIDFNGATRNATSPDIGAHEFSSNPVYTPLSGAISIGNGGTYGNLQDFFTALGLRGVNGAVTATLLDSLYEESFEIYTIPFASATNSISLAPATANRAVLRWSGQTNTQNYMLRLNHCNNINFANISFETTVLTNANLVILNGYNDNLRFYNCNFSSPSGANGYSLYAGYESLANNMAVLACDFYNNAYGLYLYGENLTLGSSIFTGQTYGAQLFNSFYAEVAGNGFYNCTNTALQVNNAHSIQIYNNYIDGTCHGISLNYLTINGTTRNQVFNNAIRIRGGNQYNGISLGGSGINLINNTILSESTNASALYSYQPGSELDIVNNILVATQSPAMDFLYFTPSVDKVIDFNCYYSNSNYLARMGTYYSSLAGLQAAYPTLNTHSISINPHLSTDLHTQSPWLRRVGMFRSDVTTDMDNEPRGEFFDIGADQQTGAYGFTPMLGSYNVGPGGAYPTVEAFISDLELLGTSGEVIANLLPGVYGGYYVLSSFPRADANSRLIWNALPGASFMLMPVNSYNYDNYVFLLDGADKISFQNFNVAISPSSRQSVLFLFKGICNDIRLLNCNFAMGTQSSTAILAENSISDGLTITNCSFSGGTNGIYLSGAGYETNHYQNIRIENSSSSGTGCPFSISKASSVKLISNVFEAFTSAPSLSYVYGNTDITRNKFRSHGYTGSYSGGTILSLSNVQGTAEQPIEILANILYSRDNQCQALIGLSLASSAFIRLYHNSISVDNYYPFEYGSALALSSVSNLISINNVFSSQRTGYAINLNQCDNLTFSHNAYFNGGKYLGKLNSTDYEPQSFIPTVLLDADGIYANPLMDLSGYSTCQFLGGKGADSYVQSDVDNNVFLSPVDIGANVISDAEPLNGTITIGTTGTYQTLEAALNALMSRGVNAPTQLFLQSGSYNINKELSYIPNTLIHPITITGAADAYILGNAFQASQNFMLNLRNVHNLTLDGLNFYPQNTEYSRAITFSRYHQDVTIQNCTFTVLANSLSSDNSAAIYAYDAPFDDFTIHNCSIQNFAYGIYVAGNTSYPDLNTDLLITSNSIASPYQGIYIYGTVSPVVIGNTISNYRAYGITLNTNKAAARIERNRVYGNGNRALTFYNHNSIPARPLIATNYLHNASSSANGVFELSSTPNADVFFNTMVSESGNGSAYAFAQGSGCSGLQFADNLVQSGASVAASFYALSQLTRFDHNLFYGTATNKVQLGGTPIANLSQWTAATGDLTCIFANPLLNAGTYTLQSGSPAINGGIAIAGLDWDIEANLRENPDLGCWEFNNQVMPSPTNLDITIDEASQEVVLTWTAVTGAVSYKVFRSTTPAGDNWSTISTAETSYRMPLSYGYKFFKISASN